MSRPSLSDYGTHDESAFPHLWDGVVGAWAPCLGPTGLRLHDFSRMANWGNFVGLTAADGWTIQGGVYSVQGGSSAGPRVDSSYLIPATNFTYDVWCRPTASDANSRPCGDASATVGTAGTAIIAGIVSGYYVVARNGANNGAGDLYGGTRLLNTWQHVVVSFHSVSGASLFVDGIRVATNSIRTQITPYNRGWTLLADDSVQSFFAGQVASSFVWDRVLPQNEIAEIYQIGPGGMYTRRRRRRAYSFRPSFQAAWARGSNVLLQPCGVS